MLSVVGKLFSSILNNRLNDCAENYNVYIEAQAGFRKGMGTTDNIFILHGLISHCINNNEKLFAAFVDFQKAFDYIVHDILWFKDICGYFQCAPFPRLQTGKVVWVLSFDP